MLGETHSLLTSLSLASEPPAYVRAIAPRPTNSQYSNISKRGGQGARIGANRSALLADRAPLIDQMQSSSREAVAKSGILLLPWGAEKRQNATRVKDWATTIAILALLSASLALAEDFKTVSGRVYKDATVSRVEADGIVLKTKTGISKVYFVELPKDVQERFHYGSAMPTGKTGTQRIDKTESANHATASFDGSTFADKFAEKVSKKLDERESILQGKHTPGPAELTVTREINFHKAFLAGIAIIATVLFAIVWARFK